MDLKLKGKTALVSGASQGIGRAVAKGLAREGVRVAIAARRTGDLETLATEIEADGGARPAIITVDLYDPEAPGQLAHSAKEALGTIDILINAAGGSRPVPFEAGRDKWDEGMLLNFFRVRELTHEVVPGMIESRWGRIINITGTSEPETLNVANSAKAAVHGWSKALSSDIAKHGITMNCLQPGRIVSEQILRYYPTEESRQKFSEERIPVGRLGEAEEFANVTVFFCSPLASYVTGTVIPIDGGLFRYAF